MTARLTFHGAAECVTGSCMLLETAGKRLLVDCGMFQGPKTLKQLNYEPFPFAPASIDPSTFGTHAIAKSTSPLARASCGTMSPPDGMISTSRPSSSK